MHTTSPIHKASAPHEPLVSVIVIFLNAGKFLAEAVESVLAQTYPNWELILVDDGSTDESQHIARGYANQNPRQIRYLDHDGHQNLGKSVSRNYGVSLSHGELIAFLDADDVWLPNKLTDQVNILRSQPEAVMLYGRTQYWYSWDKDHQRFNKKDRLLKLPVPSNTLVRPPRLLISMLWNEAWRAETVCPYPTSVIVRRRIFEEIGGFEAQFRNLYDDVVFFAKVFLHAPVYVSGECWDRYRMNSTHQFSNSYATAIEAGQWHPSKPNSAEFEFLSWLNRYAKDCGVRSFGLRKVLMESLLPYNMPKVAQALRSTQKSIYAVRKAVRKLGQRCLPAPIARQARRLWDGQKSVPGVGEVRFGDLRRLTPFSRCFGFDRGVPLDRYYIERFLMEHARDIRGCVLEIADNSYTKQFGGEQVTSSEVLHAVPGNPQATIVGDLSQGDGIPSDHFDCIILTQTLLCIYDVHAAIKTVHRILKPGGVALVTLPGICQIAQPDMQLWGDFWRFTTLSARRMFEAHFPPTNLTVASHGNILVAISFLHGLGQGEITETELDYTDPDYQVSITVRAMKPLTNL